MGHLVYVPQDSVMNEITRFKTVWIKKLLEYILKLEVGFWFVLSLP